MRWGKTLRWVKTLLIPGTGGNLRVKATGTEPRGVAMDKEGKACEGHITKDFDCCIKESCSI